MCSNLYLNYLLLDILSIAYLFIYQLLLQNFYGLLIPDPPNVLLGLVIDIFFNLKEIKDIYSHCDCYCNHAGITVPSEKILLESQNISIF